MSCRRQACTHAYMLAAAAAAAAATLAAVTQHLLYLQKIARSNIYTIQEIATLI